LFDFTSFCLGLPDFTCFYQVLSDFVISTQVLPGFTWFCLFFARGTGFLPSFIKETAQKRPVTGRGLSGAAVAQSRA
jgi:hypothetical protein